MTKEEIISTLENSRSGSMLLFFDYPDAKATMVARVGKGVVRDRIFLKYDQDKDGNMTADVYHPHIIEDYESIFGYEKKLLGVDLFSEHQIILNQRQICAEYPREANERLVNRYNKEFAPPLGEGELSRQDAERVLTCLLLTGELPSRPIMSPTLVFQYSPDEEGIILAGYLRVNYEDYVRAVRNKVIELTGAIPHKLDDLYLVY